MGDRRQPESPFLPEDIREDWIGPPDPGSKIRPIRQFIPPNETKLERIVREKEASVLAWNHMYWKKHNKSFKKERRLFVEAVAGTGPEQRPVSDQQMAVFYRQFMERNRRKQYQNSVHWYGHNFQLAALAALVAPLRLLRRLRVLR